MSEKLTYINDNMASAEHEIAIADPGALITSRDKQPPLSKSGTGEPQGVIPFVPGSAGQVAAAEQRGGVESKKSNHSFKQKLVAAALALLRLLPFSSTTSETYDVPVENTITVTQVEQATIPVNCEVDFGNEWDEVNDQTSAAEAGALAVQQCMDDRLAQYEANLPGNATVESVDGGSVSVNSTGMASDEFNVGPNSDNQSLGSPDQHNQDLAIARAEEAAQATVEELGEQGIDVDQVSINGIEDILTPEQIAAGDNMAQSYGYDTLSALVWAVETGHVQLNSADQDAYNEMMPEQRGANVEVNGNIVITYQKTHTETVETTKTETETTKHWGIIIILSPGMSTEEHVRRDNTKGKKKAPSHRPIVPGGIGVGGGGYRPRTRGLPPLTQGHKDEDPLKWSKLQENPFGRQSVRLIGGRVYKGKGHSRGNMRGTENSHGYHDVRRKHS